MSLNKFLSFFMGKNGYKHSSEDGINKYYNKDFEVMIYKDKKQQHSLVVDKRNADKQIVYNNLDIAIDRLKTC